MPEPDVLKCEMCGIVIEADPVEVAKARADYAASYEDIVGFDPGELTLLCRACAEEYDAQVEEEVRKQLNEVEEEFNGHYTSKKTLN